VQENDEREIQAGFDQTLAVRHLSLYDSTTRAPQGRFDERDVPAKVPDGL
jgi:hypothetical protein